MQWTICGKPIKIFYYKMKCVLWLGREEHVELEITKLNFGPTPSLWPMRTIQRNQGLKIMVTYVLEVYSNKRMYEYSVY